MHQGSTIILSSRAKVSQEPIHFTEVETICNLNVKRSFYTIRFYKIFFVNTHHVLFVHPPREPMAQAVETGAFFGFVRIGSGRAVVPGGAGEDR